MFGACFKCLLNDTIHYFEGWRLIVDGHTEVRRGISYHGKVHTDDHYRANEPRNYIAFGIIQLRPCII